MRTILVVDDHAPTVSTLCLILDGNGYRAFGALNADDAKRQFREQVIDLLLVDHGLPGVSRAELAARLVVIRPVPGDHAVWKPGIGGQAEAG